MSPEPLVVPESKEVFRKQKNGGKAKGQRSQPEKAPNDGTM